MFDYRICNATVIDGTGRPAFPGDVGIVGSKIASVGNLAACKSCRTLDGKGLILTPGFIDIHRHGDIAAFRPDYGKAELAQGLTSVVNGNCGLSAVPLVPERKSEILSYLSAVVGQIPDGLQAPDLSVYFQKLNSVPQRIHNGMLLGMGTLRSCVAGFRSGSLSRRELEQIHRLLEQGLCQGALGVSLGLGYAPECFYSTDELLQALEPLRGSGIPITVHIRQEGDGVVEALEEMILVARALRTPVQISHLKAIGKKNWRKAVPKMLSLLRCAREEGLDISCDLYPYSAGSTQLLHVLPPEYQDGGIPALVSSLRDPSCRQQMRRRMQTGSDFENISLLVGFENIRSTSLKLEKHRPFEGASISEIAAALGKDPYDTLFDLLADENCGCAMIDWIVSEEDISAILEEPYSMVISDATYPETGLMHPRVYGTYPHFLEHFVRDKRLLTLEQAVQKITELPAQRLGLAAKGRIAPGMDADLCLFDFSRIHENATWQSPRQYASGMEAVFVSGKPAILEGTFTSSFNGTILTKSQN